MEDFETNNFSKFDWQMGGNSPWIITGSSPHEGLYSAKSGDINDNQTSELSVSMDVSSPDTISFWKKVSCEQHQSGSPDWYDNLEFLIDGNSKDKWDGIDINWSKAEYVVPTGTHVFKWVYQKDGSVSDGDDCAYLDFIIFPPSIKVVNSINENTRMESALSCYPNPSHGISDISFSLNVPSNVSLKLFDLSGKLVENLLEKQNKKEGAYNVLVNMAKYPAGVYYLSLITDKENLTKKIVVIK
jgi:hypothetical protein